MVSRRIVAVTFVTIALAGGLVGQAWACTPLAAVTLSQLAAGAESRVTVNGTAFHSGVPVEIRWNGVTGPVLATATGPDFSVPVTVPGDADPGAYYILAVQRDAEGTIIGRGASTFAVAEPAGPPAASLASSTNPSQAPAASDDGRTYPLALGVAVATLGLVTLFSMTTVFAVRRRRAPLC